MKKILMPINSQQMDLNAISFACHIAKLTGSDLSAVFLENIVIEKQQAVLNEDDFLSDDFRTYNQKVQVREDNISLFKSIAEEEGANAHVHFDTGVPLDEILSESRFADILIIDPAISFSENDTDFPTQFVKDLLQGAGCPVIIVPEEFDFIDNILFFYDGSKSSIFAIKQFTYLFPELRGRKASVLYMNKENEPLMNEDLAVVNWLKEHYLDIEFVTMNKLATEAFFDYLRNKKNGLVVMGAYGRGLLSSFFPYSDEEENIQQNTLPLFVAHY